MSATWAWFVPGEVIMMTTTNCIPRFDWIGLATGLFLATVGTALTPHGGWGDHWSAADTGVDGIADQGRDVAGHSLRALIDKAATLPSAPGVRINRSPKPSLEAGNPISREGLKNPCNTCTHSTAPSTKGRLGTVAQPEHSK